MKRLRKFFAGLLALTTLVSTVPVNAYDADVPSVLNTGNTVTANLIVHYQDTEGNTIHEDNVYSYTATNSNSTGFVEKIPCYTPTGDIIGTVNSPFTLYNLDGFKEKKGTKEDMEYGATYLNTSAYFKVASKPTTTTQDEITVTYEKNPSVKVYNVFNWDYDNATYVGEVTLESLKYAAGPSVSTNQTELSSTGNHINIPKLDSSNYFYKGYNWGSDKDATSCTSSAKALTDDDVLYVCYYTKSNVTVYSKLYKDGVLVDTVRSDESSFWYDKEYSFTAYDNDYMTFKSADITGNQTLEGTTVSGKYKGVDEEITFHYDITLGGNYVFELPIEYRANDVNNTLLHKSTVSYTVDNVFFEPDIDLDDFGYNGFSEQEFKYAPTSIHLGTYDISNDLQTIADNLGIGLDELDLSTFRVTCADGVVEDTNGKIISYQSNNQFYNNSSSFTATLDLENATIDFDWNYLHNIDKTSQESWVNFALAVADFVKINHFWWSDAVIRFDIPEPAPLVEIFEVYDYDYDNATSLGVVSIDSTKTITASVSRNNDTLEVTSSQIKIPLNTASYVSYKGYNWSENRGSSTCAKVGKVITADDKLYICYETTPVTINIADCYTTSLDYLSNDVVTRISDSVVGGTTKKYYVLDRAGYEFKEVRKGDELGEIVPVLEDENGKYIEVTATDYTNYYFRYLRTANKTYKVDYYNVYDWDFDNAEYVETYSKLIAPDGTVSYEGTKLLDDSGNWIDANKEGYIFDGHYSIELETEGEFEKQHTVYYRFFSSDTDKNIDYTIKYQAVWNDGTPAQGVILNEETTGVDGFISTEDNFKVTYEGLRPIYQVQQNNDILEYNFNNQFKWTGMTCADFTDSTKTIELVATNPSINETSTRSLVLEKRNTWTGGTKYNISEFNGDDFSSLFFATSNSTENIELEYSDAGVEHTLVIKVNMGVKPTVKKLKVPVEIIYQKDTTVLPDYTGQDYETVTIENTTFPEVEVIVKEHIIGDGYTIISTPTLTFNLEDYDFSAGLQAVADSYGVDINKLSLKEKDCGVGYSAFNTGENDGIYDESEFDNLIKTLVVDDTTKLLDSSVTFSVKEDLAHFGKFTIFLKYTVEPPSVIVHYKDTDGNTIREDNVYIDYTKVYYPVEKIDDYIPTGVVEGSVIYPVVLEQEQQFAEYRGDNTGDKSHTLKLRLGSPMNITSFQDSEITVIYEKEPNYKITVVDEFYNIDGNLVKADERLVEYKKAGENYSYYALNPVPDGYICFSDTSYSGVVTQDTIITFVYKDDYARFVTVKGVVMYKDGTPVANKRIEIHSTPRYTVTDENGYYEVKNVEVGDHKFTIFANNEDDTPLVTCDLSVTKPDEDTVKVTFKSENTDVETDTSVTDILEIDAYLPVYTIKVIDEYYTDGVLDKSEVRCEDSYKAGETYAYSALSPEDYTVSGITEASGVALSNLTITFKYLKTTTKPDEPEPASYRLKVIDNFYNSDYVLQDSSVRVNNEVTEGTPYDYKALDVDDYKVSGTKHYTGVIKEDTTLVFTYIQEVKEPERYTLKVRDIFFDENGVVEKDSVRYEEVVDSGFSYYFKALDTADYKVTSAIEVNGVVTQNTEIIFTYSKKPIPVPEPEAKEYKITVIDKFIIGKDVIEYNPYYFDNLGDEVTVTETEDGYELSIARFVTEDHEVSVQSIVRCIDTYKEGAEYFYSALNLPEAWKVISDTHYSGVVTKDETLVFVYTLNFEDDDDIPEIPDNPEPTIPFEEPVTGIETGKGLEVVIFFGCLIALLVILKRKEK